MNQAIKIFLLFFFSEELWNYSQSHAFFTVCYKDQTKIHMYDACTKIALKRQDHDKPFLSPFFLFHHFALRKLKV